MLAKSPLRSACDHFPASFHGRAEGAPFANANAEVVQVMLVVDLLDSQRLTEQMVLST